MTTRFLIGIGLAFALIFAGGIAAVIGVNSVADRPMVISAAPPQNEAQAPAALPETSAPAPTPALAATATTPAPTPAVGLPSAQPVMDADLANLAAAVKLGATTTGDVTKAVWAREVPIAQNLLKGMCDCDQRNWLKHFVETGQEAISGSDHYPESVEVLTKLRRSNTDLNTAQATR